jgi:hypothetical protein
MVAAIREAAYLLGARGNNVSLVSDLNHAAQALRARTGGTE